MSGAAVGDVEVRLARAGDGAGFARLFAAVAAEGRWIATEPPVDEPAVAGRVEAALADPTGSRYAVAVSAGEVVGGLGLDREARGVRSIGMMVAAGRRGQGIGGRLLEVALAEARRLGAHRVELGVYPDNPRAVGLYARYGFVVEGLQRQRYLRADGTRRDALLMALLLDG